VYKRCLKLPALACPLFDGHCVKLPIPFAAICPFHKFSSKNKLDLVHLIYALSVKRFAAVVENVIANATLGQSINSYNSIKSRADQIHVDRLERCIRRWSYLPCLQLLCCYLDVLCQPRSLLLELDRTGLQTTRGSVLPEDGLSFA
jgi:hypothetical protein